MRLLIVSVFFILSTLTLAGCGGGSGGTFVVAGPLNGGSSQAVFVGVPAITATTAAIAGGSATVTGSTTGLPRGSAIDYEALHLPEFGVERGAVIVLEDGTFTKTFTLALGERIEVTFTLRDRDAREPGVQVRVSIESPRPIDRALGELWITIDGDTPEEAILVGDDGAIWQPVATYRAAATTEAFRLATLSLMNTMSESATGAPSATVEADASVITLGLFDENDVLKSEETFRDGKVVFDLGFDRNDFGLGAIMVPENDFAKFTVRVKLGRVNDALKTGRRLRLAIDPDGRIEAVGETSGVIVNDEISAARFPDGTLRWISTVGKLFSIRRTRPTLTVVPQTTSEQTLTNGSNKVVFRYAVAAHAGDDVPWKAIKFDIEGRFGGAELIGTSATDGRFILGDASSAVGFVTEAGGAVKLSRPQLFEADTGQEVQAGQYQVHLDWDVAGDNGEVVVVLHGGLEELVAAGTAKTYELRGTVSGATLDGDFVDVSLDNQADQAGTLTRYVSGSDPDEVDGFDEDAVFLSVSMAAKPYSFLWSDNSGAPHSAATSIEGAKSRDWTNDRLVEIERRSWNRTANLN